MVRVRVRVKYLWLGLGWRGVGVCGGEEYVRWGGLKGWVEGVVDWAAYGSLELARR